MSKLQGKPSSIIPARKTRIVRVDNNNASFKLLPTAPNSQVQNEPSSSNSSVREASSEKAPGEAQEHSLVAAAAETTCFFPLLVPAEQTEAVLKAPAREEALITPQTERISFPTIAILRGEGPVTPLKDDAAGTDPADDGKQAFLNSPIMEASRQRHMRLQQTYPMYLDSLAAANASSPSNEQLPRNSRVPPPGWTPRRLFDRKSSPSGSGNGSSPKDSDSPRPELVRSKASPRLALERNSWRNAVRRVFSNRNVTAIRRPLQFGHVRRVSGLQVVPNDSSASASASGRGATDSLSSLLSDENDASQPTSAPPVVNVAAFPFNDANAAPDSAASVLTPSPFNPVTSDTTTAEREPSITQTELDVAGVDLSTATRFVDYAARAGLTEDQKNAMKVMAGAAIAAFVQADDVKAEGYKARQDMQLAQQYARNAGIRAEECLEKAIEAVNHAESTKRATARAEDAAEEARRAQVQCLLRVKDVFDQVAALEKSMGLVSEKQDVDEKVDNEEDDVKKDAADENAGGEVATPKE